MINLKPKSRIPHMELPVKLILALTLILTLVTWYRFHVQLWTITDGNLSEASKTTPFWDFNNLWSGSKMVLADQSERLFDMDAYRATLREMADADLPDHEWSYPPNILLIGAPLATLPQMTAYLIWTFGTLAAFFAALRLFKLPKLAAAFLMVSPALIWNMFFGQNGALTAALLLGGLMLCSKRPWIAGVLFGLLTIKPHLGILIPFILLAGGNWRCIVAAAVTGISMFLLSGVLFGFDLWHGFVTYTQPLMSEIMHASWGQSFQGNAATWFAFARSMGANLGLAYAVQGAVTLFCIGYAFTLWRRESEYDRNLLVSQTVILAFLAAPYGYTYDMPAIAVTMAVLFLRRPVFLYALPLAVLWRWPMMNHQVFEATFLPLTAPLVTLLALAIARELHGKSTPAGSPMPA